MTHAERVVSRLADEIRKLQIELAIVQAELDILKEDKRLNTDKPKNTDAPEASFLLEENT